jgi:hypothetical protein
VVLTLLARRRRVSVPVHQGADDRNRHRLRRRRTRGAALTGSALKARSAFAKDADQRF